jgi:hypothetical protein
MIHRFAIGALATITITLILADVILIALPRTTAAPDVYGLRGIGVVFAVVCTSLGGAIALRHPSNSVGWIYLSSGVFGALMEAATEYSSLALLERGLALPGGEWAVWLADVALGLALIPMVTFVPLMFPNGRLPSARWRPVAWYSLSTLVVAIVVGKVAFTPVGYGVNGLVVPNPVSLIAIAVDRSGQLLFWGILLVSSAIPSGAALVHRFRRSRGVERTQLKWVAYAAAILVAGFVLVMPVSFGRKPLEIAQQLISLSVPVAAGIAILRYRLYDIDLLIKRTLVYGSLTAVLGLVYVASVLLSQQLLRGFTGGSDIAVAVSTLLVVALFQPMRRRAQDAVDRRFYRARYDAARTIDAFSVRLRGDVDLDSVRADLIGVIHDTIHPAHASVWLRRPR